MVFSFALRGFLRKNSRVLFIFLLHEFFYFLENIWRHLCIGELMMSELIKVKSQIRNSPGGGPLWQQVGATILFWCSLFQLHEKAST